ncbi:hypothetical protein F511_09998 [Dorcoceras hygrometricum]|uniref:Uncharacterized protein n=1 Tax=Dorcoceras hygrometricum TaxID=472368 RepID=A0A2Z7ARN3_9LAMI|nr:hypothetical protein F511_09998 [Dorcoceras hygrometricum]
MRNLLADEARVRGLTRTRHVLVNLLVLTADCSAIIYCIFEESIQSGDQLLLLFTERFFPRFLSIQAFVFDDFGGAGFLESCSVYFYSLEVVERLVEVSVKLLLYEDSWRNLIERSLIVVRFWLLFTERFFPRFLSIPAFFFDDFGGAGFLVSCSVDCYSLEVVERLVEVSVKLLVYEDSWRNLIERSLIVVRFWVVERLVEVSVKLLVYEDSWRNLIERSLIVVRFWIPGTDFQLQGVYAVFAAPGEIWLPRPDQYYPSPTAEPIPSRDSITRLYLASHFYSPHDHPDQAAQGQQLDVRELPKRSPIPVLTKQISLNYSNKILHNLVFKLLCSSELVSLSWSFLICSALLCVGDPDPPPGEAAEEHKKRPGDDQYEKQQLQLIVIHRAFKTIPCWHLCLAPTCITRTRLFSVDCGRLSPIRSTTRTETPSSGCTRSADEISTNGFSSSSWPETNFRRQRAAAAVAHGGRRRRRLERRGWGGYFMC